MAVRKALLHRGNKNRKAFRILSVQLYESTTVLNYAQIIEMIICHTFVETLSGNNVMMNVLCYLVVVFTHFLHLHHQHCNVVTDVITQQFHDDSLMKIDDYQVQRFRYIKVPSVTHFPLVHLIS